MQSRQKSAYILLGCVILLSGIALFTNIHAQETRKAQIGFASDRDATQYGDWDIYVMDADGNNVRRLTDHPAQEASPAWSPDGRSVAFTSTRDQTEKIYIMDADGKNVRRLTDFPGMESSPAWSPDGRKIAFRHQSLPPIGIMVIDSNGENVQNLTWNTDDRNPTWSPDGQSIAFYSMRDWGNGKSEIYVLDVGGDEVRNITNHPARDYEPNWSPDGRKILFVSGRDDDDLEKRIFVMDADGNNVCKLTPKEPVYPEHNPAWSPDGREIVFASVRDDNTEIHVIDADGNDLRRLTNHPGVDIDPTWTPFVIYPVSPAGKLGATWGWLKQNHK